jgi:hypothetical protein
MDVLKDQPKFDLLETQEACEVPGVLPVQTPTSIDHDFVIVEHKTKTLRERVNMNCYSAAELATLGRYKGLTKKHLVCLLQTPYYDLELLLPIDAFQKQFPLRVHIAQPNKKHACWEITSCRQCSDVTMDNRNRVLIVRFVLTENCYFTEFNRDYTVVYFEFAPPEYCQGAYGDVDIEAWCTDSLFRDLSPPLCSLMHCVGGGSTSKRGRKRCAYMSVATSFSPRGVAAAFGHVINEPYPEPFKLDELVPAVKYIVDRGGDCGRSSATVAFDTYSPYAGHVAVVRSAVYCCGSIESVPYVFFRCNVWGAWLRYLVSQGGVGVSYHSNERKHFFLMSSVRSDPVDDWSDFAFINRLDDLCGKISPQGLGDDTRVLMVAPYSAHQLTANHGEAVQSTPC